MISPASVQRASWPKVMVVRWAWEMSNHCTPLAKPSTGMIHISPRTECLLNRSMEAPPGSTHTVSHGLTRLELLAFLFSLIGNDPPGTRAPANGIELSRPDVLGQGLASIYNRRRPRRVAQFRPRSGSAPASC